MNPFGEEKDSLVWDYKEALMDKKALKDYMEEFWKEKSAGEVEGKTIPITWIVTNSEEFRNMVGNECFFKHKLDHCNIGC